ncbi:MAG TPA: 5'-3' exonuclease H3TH domain-containing protein [Steroidobacteraceae bacterium]|nr:5'-3' exonuclease H3TH domain-containing protein [Steroidobacteraceae bacterium]
MSAGALQPQTRSGIVYYIDASYFIFRAYHSMPADMVDGDGNATHALYGFARFISDLLERVRPDRIGVAFDVSLRGETSFRNGIYPPYKANREAPPADLERQFVLCREFCRHMGIAEFASERYEADDIIGTLAARSRAAGLRNVLVTRDKDLSQLIRDGDVFWDYSGNIRYHYHDIGPRFGATPELIADFLALTGDSVDNIPGVPGVGKKTAAELLAVFGSLDELYANLDRIPSMKLRGAAALAARLLAHKEAAYLARRLTGIVCDIPLEATLEDLKRRRQDRAGLDFFFDTHGFGAILRQQVRRIAAGA